MQPSPDAPNDAPPAEVAGAVVVPPVRRRYKQAAGVLTADGDYVEAGATHRAHATLTTRPDMPPDVAATLPGRWLWGGLLFDHFGHFLVESSARYWRWLVDEGRLDGIVFVPKSVRRGPELTGWQRDVLDAWGIDAPVHVARAPVRVERLVVPEQAICILRNTGGTPLMRDTARRHFGASIAPEGPRRLYVSRAGLPAAYGTLLSEPAIEAALMQDGYEVMHPQEHSVPEQIARYKAAERIVFADGSAAHLFAYLARPGQRMAYLPRRDRHHAEPFDHVEGFGGAETHFLPAPSRLWLPIDRKRFRAISHCAHDLPALGAALEAAGMIETPGAWRAPHPRTLEGLVERMVPSEHFAEVAA